MEIIDFKEPPPSIFTAIFERLTVALFIPNLIGYIRFAFLFIGAFFGLSKGSTTMYFPLFYGMSQALDAVDGLAARKFDQCSKFGAGLDMVCDRASIATIFMILAVLYPK